MSTIVVPPLILTIPPIALGGAVGDQPIPPDSATQVVARSPSGRTSRGESWPAFAVQQFLVIFLIIPAYIPLRSRPSRSWVRSRRAASSRSSPRPSGPVRAAGRQDGRGLVPGVIASWAAYAVIVALASVGVRPALFAIVTDLSWLAAVFAARAGGRAVSVVAGVIVSSRVNDPRIAQQIGGVVIIPIIAVVLVRRAARRRRGARVPAARGPASLDRRTRRPAVRGRGVRSRRDPHALAVGRSSKESPPAHNRDVGFR